MSTIDPGIDDQIQSSSEDKEKWNEEQERQREEQDYEQPSRWWFASTACPLLAATFGPIASGFNICALVYPWRAYIPPGGAEADGIKMLDPHWLVAVNAVSLIAALIGNGSLLLNMAKRIKFSIAQPITITGFLLAGVLLIADMIALTTGPSYWITQQRAIPPANHALTSAYYYSIFAAALYMIIGFLMCLTVYGANRAKYDKSFNLTSSQRTLMLQTMSFVTYLLLGALVFSKIEGWKFLDAVYWAEVTLLTVGLGDYSPQTDVGRGLLFPFAIGGILMIGLVIGSIRSLVLDRGKQKMAARITENRRESAIHNVDERRQTIKISWFAQAEFSTDAKLSPAQRREEEFRVMREVMKASDNERRYFSLLSSLFFALVLWFAGAAVFMVCEHAQGWSYFKSVYFTFVVLMTIGYGQPSPASNSGKAFFVIWSLLAVPSLTILISNMGDTFVKWFADLTTWVGSLTVLPGDESVRSTAKKAVRTVVGKTNETITRFTPPGLLGDVSSPDRLDPHLHARDIVNRVASRLEKYLEEDELDAAEQATDDLDRDIHFYHYVLARETRIVQRDVAKSPSKQYEWHEWEYYLKLMGNEDETPEFEGGTLVPGAMTQPEKPFLAGTAFTDHAADSATSDVSGKQKRSDGDTSGEELSPVPSGSGSSAEANHDGAVDRETQKQNAKFDKHTHRLLPQGVRKRAHKDDDEDPLCDWSWLSDQSPLMSNKSEAEWIVERLATALERDLGRIRKGIKKRPPISMGHARRRIMEAKDANPDNHEERCEQEKAVMALF